MVPPAHPSPVRLDPCEARPGGPRFWNQEEVANGIRPSLGPTAAAPPASVGSPGTPEACRCLPGCPRQHHGAPQRRRAGTGPWPAAPLGNVLVQLLTESTVFGEQRLAPQGAPRGARRVNFPGCRRERNPTKLRKTETRARNAVPSCPGGRESPVSCGRHHVRGAGWCGSRGPSQQLRGGSSCVEPAVTNCWLPE